LTYPTIHTRPDIEKFGTLKYATDLSNTQGLFRHAADLFNRLEIISKIHAGRQEADVRGRTEDYHCKAYK